MWEEMAAVEESHTGRYLRGKVTGQEGKESGKPGGIKGEGPILE